MKSRVSDFVIKGLLQLRTLRWVPICALIAAAVPQMILAADNVDSVTIQGFGRLTTCRSWLVYNSCTTHKVYLPEHISIDDRIALSYGSNLKNYTFKIIGIRHHGDGCTLLSNASKPNGDGEKIEVTRCTPTTQN